MFRQGRWSTVGNCSNKKDGTTMETVQNRSLSMILFTFTFRPHETTKDKKLGLATGGGY